MENSTYILPRAYEMMAILLPDQGEDVTTAAIEKMLGYITDEQGTVDSVASDSPWGRRRLAYTIRHEGVDYRDGHYVLVYFTAMPSAISEIERELKLDTNVVRYLLLTHDPHMGEKIDETAIEAEGAEEGDEAPAASTEAPAEEAATEATEAPTEEAAVEATEETESPAEATAAETTEAPAEEAQAETTEAPAEEVAAEEPAATEEPVAEDAATDEAAAQTATEETAADGEVEESAEE